MFSNPLIMLAIEWSFIKTELELFNKPSSTKGLSFVTIALVPHEILSIVVHSKTFFNTR